MEDDHEKCGIPRDSALLVKVSGSAHRFPDTLPIKYSVMRLMLTDITY